MVKATDKALSSEVGTGLYMGAPAVVGIGSPALTPHRLGR